MPCSALVALLTGKDIMNIFGISQGRGSKRFGEMLELLREAEITGKGSNRMEALEYLHRR